MSRSVPRHCLIVVLSVLAAVVMGCGGGGGGSGDDTATARACSALCTELTTCASDLGTNLATLTGDQAMTPSTCVTECTSRAETCTDRSGFLSCAAGLACTSISAVQGALSTCSQDAGCGHAGATLTLAGTVGSVSALRVSTASDRVRALVPGDIQTVLALSTGYQWWSSPVAEDGSFSLKVDPSAPVGLIFANSGDEMVGYLALPNGLASLPLQTLSEGTTHLDLGTLIADAQEFTPESSLAEFSLGDADLTALLHAGGIFGETVKNPDANGNGKIDLLEDVYYRPYVMYFVNPGSFSGLEAVVNEQPLTLNSYRFNFTVIGGSSFPDTVTFAGPQGSGLTGQTNDGTPNIGTNYASYGSPAINGVPVPPPGEYDVTMGDTNLAFQIPDQTEAIAQIAMAVPAVTLNPGDPSVATINRVDWTYQLGGLSDAAKTIDPTSLVSAMMLQIEASPADAPSYRCAASNINAGEGPGRVYDAGAVAASVTGVELDCQNIPWSIVTSIMMAYDDVYGNHVVVRWEK